MAEEVKPAGYVFDDVPVTEKQSFAATAEARVRQTCKSAIQAYLASYLDAGGCRRYQLAATAPFAGTYVTNVSQNIYDDPLRHEVLLARIWERLKGKLPAIVISDGGWEPLPSGLGGLEAGVAIDSWTSAIRATVLGTMTIEILVADTSESSASDLSDILTYIFGPLTALNRSWYLESGRTEDAWQVRLPSVGAKASAIERSSIADDPVSSMWRSTLTLEVEFEGRVQLGILNELNPQQTQAIQRDPNHQPDMSRAVYQVPTEVRMGVATPIAYQSLPFGARFISDNPRVAVIDSQGCIVPVRFGTCNILLVNNPPVAGKTGDVLASHPVTIVVG